jgi:hypothetical protein
MQSTAPAQLLRTSMVAIAIGVASVAAQAGTLTQTGATKYDTNLRLNNFSGGTSYANTTLGAVQLTYDGGSAFWAYCIDPKTSASFPSSDYTASTLAAFMNAADGYQGQMQSSGYTGLSNYGYQSNTATVASRLQTLYSYAFADSLTSNQKAAAFGYVVWEIMGSSTASALSRTSGGGLLAVSDNSADGNSIRARADQLINALNGTVTWASIGLTTAASYVYTVYYDPAPHARQNFLTAHATSVPLPGTLALAGLGLAGAMVLRRRA